MQASAGAFAPRSTVLMREVGEEAVLLDLDSGVYHTLNEVGTLIWNELTHGAQPEQIVDAIVAEFEVDCEQARQDLEAFTATLIERRLLAPPADRRENAGAH